MSGIAVQPLMPDLTDGDFGEGKRQRPAAAGIAPGDMPRHLFRDDGNHIALGHQLTGT